MTEEEEEEEVDDDDDVAEDVEVEVVPIEVLFEVVVVKSKLEFGKIRWRASDWRRVINASSGRKWLERNRRSSESDKIACVMRMKKQMVGADRGGR